MMSVLELDEAEKELQEDMELDLDDDDDDFEKVEKLTLPLVSKWKFPDGTPVNGLEVPVIKEDDFITDSMYRDDIVFGPTKDPPPHVFDSPPPPAHVCSICFKHWTVLHHFCCLPCGHMFGLSCLKDWMEGRSSDVCPRCYQNFSLETVRLLYATRLCIPAAAYRKTFVRRFPFSNFGFTAFKQYEPELRTNALNNRSDVLKQRADVLGRQNDAMKRRTELLNRMADAEKWADVLERQNDAMKRQIELLNRMTDEEDWAEASEQQADAEKRAKVLRRLAGAMGQSADEYLRKADAFGQQGKALRQQAKSLRQLVDSYLATRKLYIQSYKEFLGLHDNNITE